MLHRIVEAGESRQAHGGDPALVLQALLRYRRGLHERNVALRVRHRALPAALALNGSADGDVLLTWAPNDPDVFGYDLFRSPDADCTAGDALRPRRYTEPARATV